MTSRRNLCTKLERLATEDEEDERRHGRSSWTTRAVETRCFCTLSGGAAAVAAVKSRQYGVLSVGGGQRTEAHQSGD